MAGKKNSFVICKNNLNVFYCKNNKIVRTCSVPGCRSESYSGCNISFYSFPKNENIKIKWQKNLNITRPITKFSKVCSLHFDPTSFYTPNSLRLLKKDDIPIPAVMSIRPLPPVLAEKAKKELNEDPNRIKDDLQHMKDWIAKQRHLRARTDDQWLVAFLRGCKYSLERAKEKLDLYYTIRTTAPDLYRVRRTDPIFNEILNTGNFLILPKTVSPDSPRVTILRPGKCDADKYSLTDIWSVIGIITKIVLMDDDTTIVAGCVTILDLEGVTMSHFLQATPSNMKKLTVLGQDATPMRMKSSHYLNTPTGFETIFNAIKSLLNEKNRSRLYVHNKNYEELYKYVPKDILPAEYGGNGGTEKEIIEYWKNKVSEYATFIDEDMQFGTDECKRSGRPRTAEDMFGAEGSFRKLEFD